MRKLVGYRILSVTRMTIITGMDEQGKFIVFTYLLRRRNLVIIVTVASSSTGELGFHSMRGRVPSLHHLAQTRSGADPAFHLMSARGFPLG